MKLKNLPGKIRDIFCHWLNFWGEIIHCPQLNHTPFYLLSYLVTEVCLRKLTSLVNVKMYMQTSHFDMELSIQRRSMVYHPKMNHSMNEVEHLNHSGWIWQKWFPSLHKILPRKRSQYFDLLCPFWSFGPRKKYFSSQKFRLSISRLVLHHSNN